MVKVLVTGSFDILHPGHIFLFREAAKLGEVHVIVARDSTVRKIKGSAPILPEEMRLEVVSSIRYVHKAYLGKEGDDYLSLPIEIHPDLILLGPNQKIKVEEIETKLKERNIVDIKVQRLTQFYDKYSLCSSSKIKKRIVEEFGK